MKNNSISKSLTRYAAIQALYNFHYSKDLNDIKNFLTTNKGFLIDSNLRLILKTKMNKVFFLKIIDFIGKEKKLLMN